MDELGRLGPVPCELADRVGRAQGTARSLQDRAFKLLTTHRSLDTLYVSIFINVSTDFLVLMYNDEGALIMD